MDTEKIIAELEKAQASLAAIRELLPHTPQKAETPEPNLAKLKMAESVPASELGPIPDYTSFDWPIAVSPSIIVDNDDDAVKRYRALQVADFLGVKSSNDIVLDVGCGDGFVASEIAMKVKFTVAYDIKNHQSWSTLSNATLQFTNSKDVVAKNKYSTILVYDVLDHLEGDDPTKFMKWLASLLSPGGKIVVRTHPWTSAHGGHLYAKGHNKAFLHLVMTADELAQKGLDVPAGLRVVRPLATYDSIFKNAGLVIVERKANIDPVDKFFSGSVLDRIIKVTWKGNIDHDTALKIMTNSFIDYTLTLPGV